MRVCSGCKRSSILPSHVRPPCCRGRSVVTRLTGMVTQVACRPDIVTFRCQPWSRERHGLVALDPETGDLDVVASKMTVTDPLSSCTCSSGDVVGRFAGLILCLVVGCHEGSAHEPGTPCDEGSRCRFPLTCIEGRCELVDAAIADSDTAADREQTADGTADARDRDDTSDGTADVSEAQDRASETGDAADAGDAIDTAEEEAGTGDAAANNDAAGVPEPDRPPSMIVLASTDNGGIWLLDVPLDSINGPVPGAMRVIDVAAAAGPIGFVDDVEAQAAGQVVHVLAR